MWSSESGDQPEKYEQGNRIREWNLGAQRAEAGGHGHRKNIIMAWNQGGQEGVTRPGGELGRKEYIYRVAV